MKAAVGQTAQRFLSRVEKNFPQLVEQIQKGETVVRDLQFPFTGKVASSGGAAKIVFVEPGKPELRGHRSIGDRGLPSGSGVGLDQFRLLFAKQSTPTTSSDDGAVAAEAQTLEFKAISEVNPIPELRGAFLFIKQNGVQLFPQGIPVEAFCDTSVNQTSGVYDFEQMIMLRPETPLEIYIENHYASIPQGIFAKLILIGAGTLPKSN